MTGDWTDTTVRGRVITHRDHLTETVDGQVTGTGTMQERGARTTPALSVTGTYRRPDFALACGAMIVAGHGVRGTFQGQYTTVGGAGDTRVMTGVNRGAYTPRVSALLQAALNIGR